MRTRLYNRINNEELKQRMLADDQARTTLSFYKYARIKNTRLFRDHLYTIFNQIDVFGRIYIAQEGVNGQISIPTDAYAAFEKRMNSIDFLQHIRYNFAIEDDGKSFYKLKIKIREKIVGDGLKDETFDVTKRGEHINARKFNELTNDEKTIVVDMRNHYESEVGHFEGAICPDVETFREALPYVEELLEDKKDHNIIMYCTGGIRCEKASAYYKHVGFENVFQLDGGIIEYARQVNELNLENKYIGKNFVFDERMGERISEEVISCCHQCGTPSDHHLNCANDACHILFIQCETCRNKMDACCSEKCKSFHALPMDEQVEKRKDMEFNGTKFGKGRYKAHSADTILDKS